MGFISTDLISQIREQTDITSIIGSYVRLVSSGNSYKALCPFHKEKTASFHVIPDKQIYHCFGCGKGGDVFSFIMEAEHLAFPEAVKFLASKCGVTIPENQDHQDTRKSQQYVFLDRAASFFQNCLKESQANHAQAYIDKRGLSDDTVKKFRIGYSPNSWDSLIKHLSKNEEDLKLLEESGLIKSKNEGESYYDVFRNRLMIPILDIHGRVVAFGGRVLSEEDQPKYLNSSETETFNKRRMLFNLREAIPLIRRQNSVIIVEGYLDAISLWQTGIKNVVATLGTAISAEQIQILARNCEVLYLCYDADTAGQRATIRAISMQKDAPVNARIVAFDNPEDDPDTFIRREGPENFKKLLDNAKDIYTFLIENRTRGLSSPLEIPVKEKLIQEFKELVPAIHSSIARSEVIRKISKLLDMDSNVLEKELAGKEQIQEKAVKPGKNLISPRLNAEIQRQEWVLKHLLEKPNRFESVRSLLGPSAFSDTDLRKIFEAMSFQQQASDYSLRPAEILSSLDDPALASRLSELITTLEDRPDEPFMDCVKGLVKNHFEFELKEIQEGISKAESQEDYLMVARLSQQQIDLKRKIDMLY